ncbi:hypothetical protein [Actinomyces sp. oral taxon 181]|uniref:hypothetical protein n=1 Tax=Actinomyces sp. oral taxon 181 TaxID=712121 RepID=UPI0015BC51E0|nr:hypothetical protein [Actinomyces sp. oral taxon 181]MBS5750100.1 hypothetical protein [Actinomyces sp. oral taxon 181]
MRTLLVDPPADVSFGWEVVVEQFDYNADPADPSASFEINLAVFFSIAASRNDMPKHSMSAINLGVSTKTYVSIFVFPT